MAIGVGDADQVGAVARGATPDALLIDLMLSKRSSVEVAQDLQEMGFGETPIIGVSASPYLVEVARESDLFAAVMDKPLELDDLLLALTETAREDKLTVAAPEAVTGPLAG